MHILSGHLGKSLQLSLTWMRMVFSLLYICCKLFAGYYSKCCSMTFIIDFLQRLQWTFLLWWPNEGFFLMQQWLSADHRNIHVLMISGLQADCKNANVSSTLGMLCLNDSFLPLLLKRRVWSFLLCNVWLSIV